MTVSQLSLPRLGQFNSIARISECDGFCHWFAGFTAAEGSFSISQNGNGLGVLCRLSISLRDDDSTILESIYKTLGVGTLHSRSSRCNQNQQITWAVHKNRHHIEVILPIFEKFPLRAKKQKDFNTFAQAVRLIYSKKHLTPLGAIEIRKLQNRLRSERQYIDPGIIKGENSKKPDFNAAFGNWLAGMIDGDGCFTIHCKDGKYFSCRLSLGLRRDDLEILQRIQKTLGTGHITIKDEKTNGKYPQAVWSVTRISDLINIIIPLFRRYPLRTKKQQDFGIWSQAVNLLSSKGYFYPISVRENVSLLRKRLMRQRTYTAHGKTND